MLIPILVPTLLTPVGVLSPRPAYLLAITSGIVRSGPHASAPLSDITSYRLDVSQAGGWRPGRCRAIKLAAAPLALRRFPGSLRLLPQPEGRRAAFFQQAEDGGEGWIDVWSAAPLARIASIPCPHAVRVDWMASRPLLVVTERDGEGYATQIVSSDGTASWRLPRTLGVVEDIEERRAYAVTYSAPDAVVNEIVASGAGLEDARRALESGTVRFQALDHDFALGDAAPPARAARTMLGSEGSIAALARLVSPLLRPIGFARHWAIVRAGVLGVVPGTATPRVFDLLGFPRCQARLVRSEVDDFDQTFGVGTDGSLRLSGRIVPFDGTMASEDDAYAARVTPAGRDLWLIPGPRSVRSVVLWDR